MYSVVHECAYCLCRGHNGVFLYRSPPYSLETVLLIEGEGCWFSCLFATGVTGKCRHTGSQTQILTLCSQCSYTLSHLSRPEKTLPTESVIQLQSTCFAYTKPCAPFLEPHMEKRKDKKHPLILMMYLEFEISMIVTCSVIIVNFINK